MAAREAGVGGQRADNGGAARGRPLLFWTGLLLGIGVAGFVDETVFHQLLQWHNFYWATDDHGRILSDGIFHAATTLLMLWGAARLWRAPHGWAGDGGRAVVGALLIGAGGFNAYDGIVQHVILHLHLVDEHVCATVDPNNRISPWRSSGSQSAWRSPPPALCCGAARRSVETATTLLDAGASAGPPVASAPPASVAEGSHFLSIGASRPRVASG